jgi:hypothetical protein
MNFADWPKEDLVKYLDFLMMNYRVMDAFWFINLENRHGLEEACRVNELVWGKVSALAARDLKKRFCLKEKGLKGFLKAQLLFPWAHLVGYAFSERDDELILEVPCCPAQDGRIKHGLGEYPCKAMHQAEFEGFAHEIDPNIKVECIFAPPDDHPREIHCKWRFYIADK